MSPRITLQQLAEKINGNYWEKGNLKRIYLDAGHNTKKMSTKTFVWQNEEGDFIVSCKVECPSQPWEWCKSQEDLVKQSVSESIEQAIWEINNPDSDYNEYQEQVESNPNEIQDASEVKEKKDEISTLTIDNVGDYLLRNDSVTSVKVNSTLWELNYHHRQLLTYNRFLNEKDDWAPTINMYMFERVFLKKERSSEEVFSDRVGKIEVGDASIEFDDVLDFIFIGKRGKNGPNKKNVFAPKEIPAHIMDALQALLEKQKVKRIQYLHDEIKRHTDELISTIEKYKAENGH